MKITIHCSHCEGTFDFEHPSVEHAAQLQNATLKCPWCGLALRMPANEVHMQAIMVLPDNVTLMPRKAI